MQSHAVFDRFPEGRRKALTMGYDDGTIHDRKLVGIFNRHGIRGTFFLNSGRLDRDGFLARSEVAALFANHEVASHTVNHPCLTHLTPAGIAAEVMEDRRALEALTGCPVRGLAYPGCDFDERVVALLPAFGIGYARTCVRASDFAPPADLLRWASSCHHAEAEARADAFLKVPPTWGRQLLYIMGHSYEFDRNGNWDAIESLCQRLGRNPAIWYATNGEIADYLKAVQSVQSSVDGTIIRNPSARPVWFSYPDLSAAPRVVLPDETLRLA